MLFKPAQLGLARLDPAELVADRKACKKIGPCGVGKKALAWYFDLPHADAAQLAKIRKELMPQAAQAAPANNEEKKGETQIGA